MSEMFAALDLGSNSFHLLLARRRDDAFDVVERIKDKVQLLSGFRDGLLAREAMLRGEACLGRFAQRLAAVPRPNLKLVGTHALRVAANSDEFAALAQRLLGVPLEVVSGDEEARLVYLGVAHHLPQEADRGRLVVDVGGGSTELAWGSGSRPGQPDGLASYPVGCVALTEACIAAESNPALAFVAARREAVEALRDAPPVADDVEVLGTSGTIESVQSVSAANGGDRERITRDGLRLLTDAIIEGRWLVDAGLPGLAPERVDIFAAGLAVVDALFHVLGCESMRFVDASLQDGLLHRNLPPPAAGSDQQSRTVARLQRRFSVDTAQALRVRDTALALLDACQPVWQIPPRRRDLLGWAAELHEIGSVVAPRHYHRHGAYLLQNSDMPAFSGLERDQLALLVRGHRRAFPGLALRAYDEDTARCLLRLLALLRIAVIVHRGHEQAAPPIPSARASTVGVELVFPAGWLAGHPLSAKEFDVERGQLARAGFILGVT